MPPLEGHGYGVLPIRENCTLFLKILVVYLHRYAVKKLVHLLMKKLIHINIENLKRQFFFFFLNMFQF